MNKASEDPQCDATIVILTYNGEKFLDAILTAIERQQFDGSFEVLVVDSGSTDSTLDIVESHEGVLLHQIPNDEFGHGRTRNLAAHLARGEIVVYLTHDAVPATDRWLYELVAPFRLSDRVVAVMGSQTPRADAFPLLRYEIEGVFAGFGPGYGTTLFYDDDFIRDDAVRNAVSFYSDVNSAARRSVLIGEIPYRDVSYAEDQLFGKDVISAGYIKAYAPRAVVEHSNEITLRGYDDRMFEETQGLREVGIDVSVPSRSLVARMALMGAAKDAVRIVRDKRMGRRTKVKALVVNPAYHIQKWRGVRRGASAPIRRYGD